jgi:signal peptidase I
MRLKGMFLLIGCGVIGSIAATSFSVFTVQSRSMYPTFSPGQHVVTIKTPALACLGPFGRYKHNDIVIVRAPTPSGVAIKRLIGAYGENIRISRGVVYRNGTPVLEPYAHYSSPELKEDDNWPYTSPSENSAKITHVSHPAIFVLGDERDESADSRIWGSLDQSSLVAKVLFPLPWL